MTLIAWILLGELLLVSLIGAVVAVMIAKVRENRLISAIGNLASGIKTNDYEHREELQYLCNELFNLSGDEGKGLVDAMIDEEKRILSVLARLLLEKDLDSLSQFHLQLADFSTLQLKATGTALRQNRLTTATELPTIVDVDEASDPSIDDAAPNSDVSLEPDEGNPTRDAEPLEDSAIPESLPLLTPEELEKEIWGELDKLAEGEPEPPLATASEQTSEVATAISDDDIESLLAQAAPTTASSQESQSQGLPELEAPTSVMDDETSADADIEAATESEFSNGKTTDPETPSQEAPEPDIEQDASDRAESDPAMEDENLDSQSPAEVEATTPDMAEATPAKIDAQPPPQEDREPSADKANGKNKRKKKRGRSAQGGKQENEPETGDDAGENG